MAWKAAGKPAIKVKAAAPKKVEPVKPAPIVKKPAAAKTAPVKKPVVKAPAKPQAALAAVSAGTVPPAPACKCQLPKPIVPTPPKI